MKKSPGGRCDKLRDKKEVKRGKWIYLLPGALTQQRRGVGENSPKLNPPTPPCVVLGGGKDSNFKRRGKEMTQKPMSQKSQRGEGGDSVRR